MIRIAVPAGENKGLDSTVSLHFGSCSYFVLVDFEERKVKTVRTVPNSPDSQHQSGRVLGFIDGQQVDVMFTGGMDGCAPAFAPRYGIQAMTGTPDTVRHMLEQYVGYRLEEAEPCRT
jgi:predicted Fe-Mo cluster-binding NifX family protein